MYGSQGTPDDQTPESCFGGALSICPSHANAEGVTPADLLRIRVRASYGSVRKEKSPRVGRLKECGLDEPALGEAHDFAWRDHKMVEDSDVDEFQRVNQPLRQCLICLAGFS